MLYGAAVHTSALIKAIDWTGSSSCPVVIQYNKETFPRSILTTFSVLFLLAFLRYTIIWLSSSLIMSKELSHEVRLLHMAASTPKLDTCELLRYCPIQGHLSDSGSQPGLLAMHNKSMALLIVPRGA